jgi:phenylcoumaran benzylic ether reductase
MSCRGSSRRNSAWTGTARARWSRPSPSSPGRRRSAAPWKALHGYTYVVAGYFAGYGLPGIGQALSRAPPTDEVVVLGDGSVKAVFVEEGDIATYTVLAAADPRAENKTMYVKPPANTLSHNELLDLWERKAGREFERVYVPEDAVLKQIQESPIPVNIVLAIAHLAYVRGGMAGFEIDPASGVDATELYPDVKYTTVDEYLNRFL